MKSISANNAASVEMPWKPAHKEENAQHAVKNAASKLYIKNMVSASCKMVVEAALEMLEFRFGKVELGEVEILDEPDEKKLEQLKTILRQLGFDLITNRRNMLVEKIRNAIVEMIFSSEEMPKTKFSDYLSKKLNLD